MNIREIASELKVQFVLEGSVRRAGNRVRINAQLIDAFNDRHIWAEQFDRYLDDIFVAQDELTLKIVNAVVPEINNSELARVRHNTVINLDAWDSAMRGWHLVNKFTADSSAEATQLLLEALEKFPGAAGLYAALSHCHLMEASFQWNRRAAESMALSLKRANQALELDPSDEKALGCLGSVLSMLRQHEQAKTTLEAAIELNPNNTGVLASLGLTLAYLGKPEGVPMLESAIARSPRDPLMCLWLIYRAILEFLERNYAEALKWCDRSAMANPAYPSHLRMRAAANAMLGRKDQAHLALRQLEDLMPGMTVSLTRQTLPFPSEDDIDRYCDALARAGMPE